MKTCGLVPTPRATDIRCFLAGLIVSVFLTGCGASLTSDTPGSLASTGDQKAGAGLIATGTTGAPVSGSTTPPTDQARHQSPKPLATPQSASAGSTPAESSLPPAEAFTAVATPGNTAYKIGPQDVLEISVFKVPELSRSVQVADNGGINLPLVGEVPAAGKTAQDVERDLTKKLGAKYLQSPQVTVFVKEYNSQRVTIEGAVKKPGVYPIRGKTSLLQFIATAEGLSDDAQSEVVVFRQGDGKRVAGKFDVEEIRAGRAADPAMQQGDVIVVSSSAMKSAWQNFLKAVPAAAAVGMFL